jgi:RNA polymerase sigma-70 factor (ECF subfamily)
VQHAGELIDRHLRGDPDAARRLVEQHQGMVYGLACRVLGPGEDARDATQETFLRALQHLHRFRGECAFSTWLYRIALNECVARGRRRRLQDRREVPLAGDDPPGPDQGSALAALERDERDEQVHRAIAALPEAYRSVVVLRYLENLSYEETAQVLQLPLGTVKVRLFRARALLARLLR